MYQVMETSQQIHQELNVGPNGNNIKIKIPNVGNVK